MAKTTNVNIILFLLIIFVIHTTTGLTSVMRAAKCLIPNGIEHTTRAALLQQCISENYGQGDETRCYDELGCFPVDKPWTSLLRPFPSPLHPAEINVRLYCYTRESPERYNVTLWPEISLEGCPFDSCRKTAFITHGFASNGNFTWMSDLKDSYLAVEDANIFLVDWGSGAELLNYLQVASNTRIVGAEVARFLNWLCNQMDLQPSQVHLMGHSLGAHISAYIGKAVPGIARLTAMDPAQPGFEGVAKECRLDKGDALYVEVLHTNAAPFIPTLGFGLIFPCGHVDFYLNGGLRQPGCHIPNITDIKGIKDLAKFPVELLSLWVACSHGRSYEYFTQTLHKNCTIWGRLAGLSRHLLNGVTLGFIDPLFSKIQKCDAKSCIPLGLETPDFTARGTFAATTYKAFPFCETDPEKNSRILHEILDEAVEEATSSLVDAAKGAADTVKGAAGTVKGAASKGKEFASGIRGKIGL